jgi:hypothetical protein
MWIKVVAKTFTTLFRDPKIIKADEASGLEIDFYKFSSNVTLYSDDRYVLADIKKVLPAIKCYLKVWNRSGLEYVDQEVV